MDFYASTDIGMKRSSNQDSYSLTQLSERVLLCAVFDGMGGHAGGEKASSLACEVFCSSVTQALGSKVDEILGTIDATKTQIINVLTKAAEEANAQVYAVAQSDELLQGMGTTLAAALVNGEDLYVINIGDSRIYLINDTITQLSHDHSYVQYLIDIGEITKEEAKLNSNKSIITRAVGTSESTQADIKRCDCEGAGILLCSDGLTNHVDDEELLSIIKSGKSAEECVKSLINRANENGGSDNITAIVVLP